MIAKIENHYSKNRQKLFEIVPLEQPLSLNIEPITFCNLKCNFCIYSCSINEIKNEEHFFEYMSDQTFELIYNQICEFHSPIKSVSFIGTGEPTLHKKLPDMIRRIKESNKAEKIILVTNGVLLNKKLILSLIDSGVDIIKISINGLSADDYFSNCGVRIEFDEFIENLKFLYKNKRKCEIYIKTLDSVLGKRSAEEFYDLFGDLCDKIHVEKTMRFFPQINYDKIGVSGQIHSRYSITKNNVRICAAPFMRMGVRVDGAVMLCGCRVGITTGNMDIRKKSLYDIWNGLEHKQVLENVLMERYQDITECCINCTTKTEFAFEEDNLDMYVDYVIKKVKNMKVCDEFK